MSIQQCGSGVGSELNQKNGHASCPALYLRKRGKRGRFASTLADECLHFGEKTVENTGFNCARSGLPVRSQRHRAALFSLIFRHSRITARGCERNRQDRGPRFHLPVLVRDIQYSRTDMASQLTVRLQSRLENRSVGYSFHSICRV